MTIICSIKILATKDRKLLFRENTFRIILAIFISMSLLSTFIGWSSQRTIDNVYQAAAIELNTIGKPVSPSPFDNVPPLSIVKNMIVYIVLIGALLSIQFGHTIAVNDRKAGVTRILFSKPFSKREFFWGKLLSTLNIIIISLFLSLVVSTLSLIFLGTLSFSSLGGLLVFYLGAFVYLGGFAFLGLFFGFYTNNSTKAILIPLLLWVAITFALPELGSALYPTSSLNPVLPRTTILDSKVLSTLHNIIYPFSISEQFKEFSANALQLNPQSSLATNIKQFSQGTHVLILLLWFCLTAGLTAFSILKFDAAEGDHYE